MPATSTAATPRSAPLSASRIAFVGALSMACAMGIGRFAFTPLLPLMQQAQGLALRDGAWLALINYLGYLLGAIGGFVRPLRPGLAIRIGVVAISVSTLAMAAVDGLAPWLALRFVSGVASALVMMGVAGWALAQLGTLGRSELGGFVFGAVGVSIAAAGAVVYVVGNTLSDPRVAWAVLGALSTVIVCATWRALAREPATTAGAAQAAAARAPLGRDTWFMIVCYGVAGFGYIVPATFLPAVARALVDDPAVFSLIWPAFGIAAAIGTIGVSTLLPHVAPRTVCGVGILVMAVGTAAPVVHMSLGALVVAAVCVGGTFIVVTLAGLQEARRLARDAPARAVAALTASFALGQLAGPLLSHAGGSALETMRLPSAVATVALVVSGTLLLRRRPRGGV